MGVAQALNGRMAFAPLHCCSEHKGEKLVIPETIGSEIAHNTGEARKRKERNYLNNFNKHNKHRKFSGARSVRWP
jgi:hypothetical protein